VIFRLAYLTLFFWIILLITNLPVASAQIISVTSDKNCYSGLDTISFRGKIQRGIQGKKVKIKIVDIH